jgi:hypothetical protein
MFFMFFHAYDIYISFLIDSTRKSNDVLLFLFRIPDFSGTMTS